MSESNGYATRDALLGQPRGRRYRTVTVEGMKFCIRSLTAVEANRHENARFHKSGKVNREAVENADCRLIQLCLVDGNRELLFTPDDVARLMEWDAAIINALVTACIEHNRLDAGVEDAEKNSEPTPD